jgi:excinuclease ABC subunit B
MTPQQISAKIRQLETQMYKHAQDLEFEDAARLRDELHRIREQGLIG